MSDYVLEILDGDQSGDTIELGAETITLGRRSTSTIVLKDEKVSGRHAEIVQEGDGFLLKDLGSTNGTLLDGRPVGEVALTPNDIIQLGRIRIAFKKKGDPTPTVGAADAISMRKLDAAAMARTAGKRRSVIPLVALVVLLLGGAAYAWLQLRGGPTGGGGTKASPRPMVVRGNMLGNEQANFEAATAEDLGWNLEVSGVAFEAGADPNSGVSAVQVVNQAKPSHGLARLAKPLRVSGGQGLRARAHVQTVGGAKGSVRLRFSSSLIPGVVMTLGGKPMQADAYAESEVAVSVPQGFDRVQMELLALLPAGSAERDVRVSFDDVSLISDEAAPKALAGRTADGKQLLGGAGSVLILQAEDQVLRAVEPIVADAALKSLQQAGHLCSADAGCELAVKTSERGFEITLSGSNATGIRLVFPADKVAGTLLTRTGGKDNVFTEHPAKFSTDKTGELLVGFGVARVWVVLPVEGPASGSVQQGNLHLDLAGAESVTLVTNFPDESAAARNSLTAAQEFSRRGQLKSCLDELERLLTRMPHDPTVAQEARRLRVALRGGQNATLDKLQAELDQASFFGTRGGYLGVRTLLQGLVNDYGEQHITQPERVAKMVAKVDAAITELDLARADVQRERLQSVAEALPDSSHASIKKMVLAYLERLPKRPKEDPEKSPEDGPEDGPEKRPQEQPPVPKEDK